MSTAANPRADNPQQGGQESTGAVTSDSLAAESMRSGGGFSENENAHESSVKGSNSTFNTTDTSGATALPPARDGAAREKQEALGVGSDEKGTSGLKYPEAAGQPSFEGAHNLDGYTGGPSSTSSGSKTTTGGTSSGATGDSFADGGAGITGSSSGKDSNISSGSAAVSQGSSQKDSTFPQIFDGSKSTSGGNTGSGNTGSSGTGSSSNRGEGADTTRQPTQDTAPNYAGVVSGAIQSEGQNKPKGKNLTEGDIPETKTFTGDVGGQHDPGRVAEQGFTNTAAEGTLAAGEAKYEQGSSTGNQFDVLSSERA